MTAQPHPPPRTDAPPPSAGSPPPQVVHDLVAVVRPRLGAAAEGSLWAALLDRDRLRLVVPLRDRAPAACDEDAEDRALLALLDAVGVPDVALLVPRGSGRPRPEDCRLWRRARSGAVGLQVRLLGLLVVGHRGSEWVSG